MTVDLCAPDVESGKLPIGSHLLQDHGCSPVVGRTLRVHHNDRILAGREVGEHEDGAVAGLAVGPENTTKKFGMRQWLGPLGGQEVRRPDNRLCARERGLILFDCAFDPAEVRRQRRNRILLERGGVPVRGHVEVAVGGCLQRGADWRFHVSGALTSLGVCAGHQAEQSQPTRHVTCREIEGRIAEWFRQLRTPRPFYAAVEIVCLEILTEVTRPKEAKVTLPRKK